MPVVVVVVVVPRKVMEVEVDLLPNTKDLQQSNEFISCYYPMLGRNSNRQ